MLRLRYSLRREIGKLRDKTQNFSAPSFRDHKISSHHLLSGHCYAFDLNVRRCHYLEFLVASSLCSPGGSGYDET
jgi:hypothetical protein